MGPVELNAFLVFESFGPTELLIVLALIGIVWALLRSTGGSRNRQEQLTARPKPDEPLQAHIAWYVRGGYRVVSQTDTTAQLVKPKEFSFGWAVFWFLFFGVGVLVYLFYLRGKIGRHGVSHRLRGWESESLRVRTSVQ